MALLGLCSMPASAAACASADAEPDALSVSDFAAAVLCEVNEERRARGRDDLHLQRNLSRAAGWQATDMVVDGYFSHRSNNGDTLADRLEKARFIPASDRWRAGENLAAGHGAEGTPAALVSAWMQSADHRYNLLDPGYTMVGIGAARGWPVAGEPRDDAMTIAMDLGWRTLSRRGSQ